MTYVPRTSPERPVCPATGSCRRPVDVPIKNFWILVFPVKYSYRCVKQGLLHLKHTFFIKSSSFVLVIKSRTLASLGHLQGTSPGCRVPAGQLLPPLLMLTEIWEMLTIPNYYKPPLHPYHFEGWVLKKSQLKKTLTMKIRVIHGLRCVSNIVDVIKNM